MPSAVEARPPLDGLGMNGLATRRLILLRTLSAPARVVAASIVAAALACPTSSPRANPSAQHFTAEKLPAATVTLTDAYGGAHRVEVEVAATPVTRQRGLMWRSELPLGKGMLFVFPAEEVQSFWMRNTLVPLDMIFISAGLRVVGIVERAEPRTLSSRSVSRPAKYVLEVPGGWSEKTGLKPGCAASLEGLAGVDVL